MTEEQNKLLNKLQNNFNYFWKEFCKSIPEIDNLFSIKEQTCIGIKYAAKYKELCESKQELVTSCCLFDEFVSSHSNNEHKKDFNELMCGIASVIKTSMKYAESNPDFCTKIKNIIKELITTMDEKPSLNNSDYRNRLNELLVFNWLNECEELKITNIAYPLGNKKDCDFRCIHKDGTCILIEVVTIHNIDLSKQDNAETFSEFIKPKIQKKYDDKVKGIEQIDNFRILPIIDYVDNLIEFAPKLDYTISTPPFTVVKNTRNDRTEICLTPIEN